MAGMRREFGRVPRRIKTRKIRDRSGQRGRKKGLPPGSLVHIGRLRAEPVNITVVDYDEAKCGEKRIKDPQELLAFRDTPTTTWINVEGLNQVEVIGNICSLFNIHPLIQEDIVNADQRPKMDDLGDYLYIVFKTLNYDEKLDDVAPEQISLIIGQRILISFQELAGDAFDPIRERIRSGMGRTRTRGPDYLAYSILDTVVDNYFVILEKLAEKVEALEDELVVNPSPDTLTAIHRLKTDMIFLRRSIWPLREVMTRLSAADTPLIQGSTRPYFRDVYDHIIHALDTMETYREIVSGMLDIYLSSVSNRLNEIMKVLTIIATIFIPLTFLTGWYGMNFKNMPELQSPWGYPMVIVVAILVAATMLVYFRRKKWL